LKEKETFPKRGYPKKEIQGSDFSYSFTLDPSGVIPTNELSEDKVAWQGLNNPDESLPHALLPAHSIKRAVKRASSCELDG
jgi:hypothetical protein